MTKHPKEFQEHERIKMFKYDLSARYGTLMKQGETAL